jgi:magnesium-transporting ATPase (P-type)
MEAAVALTAFFHVLNQAGWRYGEWLERHDPLYLQATTACLAAIVLTQMVNLFLCRHPRQSGLRVGLPANPLLWGGIALEVALILLIVYTPWGNALFGTAPLSSQVWLYVIPFVVGMGVVEEARKWLVRRMTAV